jgi:hypothetical protein
MRTMPSIHLASANTLKEKNERLSDYWIIDYCSVVATEPSLHLLVILKNVEGAIEVKRLPLRYFIARCAILQVRAG